MYKLPYFTEQDGQEVMKFMVKHPFVTLCGCNASGRPVATQVPVLFKDRNGQLVLCGHIMRNTDHHRAFIENPQVLALFTGPHTYVSASWYTNPRQGSTWNYITVHARGTLQFLDEAALIETLRETTAHFENSTSSSAAFEQLSEDYVKKMVRAIIAFEIAVSEIENVFKLSQNRDKESYQSIIQHLNAQGAGAQQIAAVMQERENKVFE